MTKAFLTADQIDRFREDGYLVVDFKINKRLLDKIINEIHPYYDAKFLKNPTFTVRIQDAWIYVKAVRELALQENVLIALKQLFGRRPLPFQTLNFPVGTGQLAHSDTIHFNSIPNGYMAGVWVALEDVTEENGPLLYYKKSHLHQEYNMKDLGLTVGDYPAYERAIQSVIKNQRFEPVLGLVKKGEAIIWHANLLHGGAVQIDKNLSRHSQVTHYFFEGCQYYTPLRSTEDKVVYRQPEWITDDPIKIARASFMSMCKKIIKSVVRIKG